MSKGSRVITLRITPDIDAAMQAAIRKANDTRPGEPYTLSSWILSCVRERLDKPARAARSAARKSQQREANKDGHRPADIVPSNRQPDSIRAEEV